MHSLTSTRRHVHHVDFTKGRVTEVSESGEADQSGRAVSEVCTGGSDRFLLLRRCVLAIPVTSRLHLALRPALNAKKLSLQSELARLHMKLGGLW